MITRRTLLRLAASAALPQFVHANSFSDLDASLSGLVEAFLKEQNFPGAQLAVGRDNQIVLSKGFGFADRENQLGVQPRTLFRLASVGKTLTAVAVFTLIEEGKLGLDTKMMDVLKVTPLQRRDGKFDPRIGEVTIGHLLQHTGGWDRNKSGDVVFQSLRISKALGIPSPPSARDVIKEVLSRPLDFVPGSRCAYSNFGYCVLGRIIEDLTDAPYGAYVHERVLKPAGIMGPKLGATFTQAEGEARYYSLNKDGSVFMTASAFADRPGKVPGPYGAWSTEEMDSLGGWIAPAEDMVRFIMSLDRAGENSPFKKPETLQLMLAPAPGPPGHDKDGKPLERSYGSGFRVLRDKDGVSFMHYGSLSGTSTILMHRADGWCWALFFNQRPSRTRREELLKSIQKVFA